MDAPSFTSTHSVIPSRMRITKLLSVVTATAEGGTNSDRRGRLVGQETCGNIPGASRRDGLFTSSSTGIVRVFGSIELSMRATAPVKVSPGKAGTVKVTVAPRLPPATSGPARRLRFHQQLRVMLKKKRKVLAIH